MSQQIQQAIAYPIQFIKGKKQVSQVHRSRMGNISNKDQLSSLHENWITTTEPQSQLLPNINLYRSRLLINTITHDYIEEYMVHFISEDDYLHYLKQTGWRQGLEHREPMAYILPIRAFINTSTTQLCTNSHTACIYFDKVEMRLTDINDIPFLDAMYMLRVCLEGFGMLKEHFGSFSIAEDMVFINEEGEVKVWIHANLSSVTPNRQQKYFMVSQKQAKKQLQNPLGKNQKKSNTRQLHQQSYNTQNSYQSPYRYPQPFNSQENAYALPQVSEQSMINEILGIVEQNIDKETLGGYRLFSEFVKERIRNENSGNQTARNRNTRMNPINSRYSDNGQGSQKFKIKKANTFPAILQVYKQFIQQNSINVPRRMEVIHNIYQNKEQGGTNSQMTPNFNMNGYRHDSSSNSNSHSNSSNKNSLHNSQTAKQYQPNSKKIVPNTLNNISNTNNMNNQAYKERNTLESRYSSGEIIAPVWNANVMRMNTVEGWKHNNDSLFEGKFDESAVTHIGNKLQNKLSMDNNNKYVSKNNPTTTPSITNTPVRHNNFTSTNTNTNTNNNNISNNNNSNISYQNRSQFNNSLNVVEIDGNLHYNLYSTSNVTTIFPITNNAPTTNTNNAHQLKSLNNSRTNGININSNLNNATGNIYIHDTNNNTNNNNTNNNNTTNSNTNISTTIGNTIYNAIKIKNKSNLRTNIVENRRLATDISEYGNHRSVSKNANNMSSHPFVVESNTARSRNSSIEVTNKLSQPISQPYIFQQPQQVTILNYSRLQHQQNTPNHSSQNSSITSTTNNLNQMKNKISAGRVSPLSNNCSGTIHTNHHVNQKKQSEDKMIKYHSPLSTLLEQKYDHGSKIIRTNQNIYHPIHNNLNPQIKNGYYRHTSNQSTKIQPKLSSINSNTNINAIKYVKTPYVTTNTKELQQSSSPLVTKPNSVNIGKNTEYQASNTPYVEKYIRDAHQQANGVPVIQLNPSVTNVSSTGYSSINNASRPVYNNYQTLNQTPYSVHRNTVQQGQQAGKTTSANSNRQLIIKTKQEKARQKSQDSQVRYYTSNETYELDSEIALDLADVNDTEI